MSKKFTKDDLEKFHDYEIFIPKRTIYLGSMESSIENGESGVDAAMAERLIKNLHFLENQSDEPITIIMNNVGGDWYHGMAIFDAIRATRCHVTIKGYGNVMSMGSVILQAADERVLMPNATVMVHDGYDGYIGVPKSMEAYAEQSKKIRQVMYDIYAERSGKPATFWEKRCVNDFWLSAEEAVEIGLADSVEPPFERPENHEDLKS